MSRPKGLPKTGGRQKGTTNKATAILRAALLRDQELTAQHTLEQIRRGMHFDIRQLFDERGNFRSIADLTEAEAAMIAGVEIVKRNITAGDDQIDTVLKIRLVDRAKYVEMAAKHHGLLEEHVTHDHGGEIRFRWAGD